MFALLLVGTPVRFMHACDCQPITAEEAIKTADVIFSGKVLKITTQAKGYTPPGYNVEFQVERTWKGALPERTAVTTADYSFRCGYHFREGETHLVFAGRKGIQLVTSACTGTLPQARAEEPMRLLAQQARLRGAQPLILNVALGKRTFRNGDMLDADLVLVNQSSSVVQLSLYRPMCVPPKIVDPKTGATMKHEILYDSHTGTRSSVEIAEPEYDAHVLDKLQLKPGERLKIDACPVRFVKSAEENSRFVDVPLISGTYDVIYQYTFESAKDGHWSGTVSTLPEGFLALGFKEPQ